MKKNLAKDRIYKGFIIKDDYTRYAGQQWSIYTNDNYAIWLANTRTLEQAKSFIDNYIRINKGLFC